MLELFLIIMGLKQKRISTNSTAKIRSSHRRCSGKKWLLRNFAKFTGKDLCHSLFLYKVADLRPSKKFLKTLVLQIPSGRLLLKNNYQTFKNLFQISLIYELPFRKTGESFIVSLFFLSVEKSTEAVLQRCSVQKIFLKISQNSQENTQIVLLIMLPFLKDKTECLTGKY